MWDIFVSLISLGTMLYTVRGNNGRWIKHSAFKEMEKEKKRENNNIKAIKKRRKCIMW